MTSALTWDPAFAGEGVSKTDLPQSLTGTHGFTAPQAAAAALFEA